MIKKRNEFDEVPPVCEHLEECKLSGRAIWYLDACPDCPEGKRLRPNAD